MKLVELVELENISKSFGSRLLYKDVNCSIKQHDKIALVGENGSGKTTLLNIILGNVEPDTGGVNKRHDLIISSLEQEINETYYEMEVEWIINGAFKDLYDILAEMRLVEEQLAAGDDPKLISEYGTLCEKLESAGGYARLIEKDAFLDIFGIQRFLNKRYGELSGGEKQYIRLALALFMKSDLIILDEPLSFLDEAKSRWLARFIAQSGGSYLIVSHDDFFIAQTAGRIFDIDNYTLNVYNANYDAFKEEKAAKGARIERRNKTSELIIEDKLASIEKRRKWMGKAYEKHKHAVIIKSLERDIKKLEKEKTLIADKNDYTFEVSSDSSSGGASNERTTELIELHGVSMAYDDKVLYEGLNLKIYRNDRILIQGENGAGKTTLLKIIAREAVPDAGGVYCVPGIKMGYVPQEFEEGYANVTVFEYFSKKADSSDTGYLSLTIENMYRDKEDITRRYVNTLSGGEKKRLQIMAALINKPDLLLVDEIYTYMDAFSQGKIIEMIEQYQGAVVMVSHRHESSFSAKKYKRYFIEHNRLVRGASGG